MPQRSSTSHSSRFVSADRIVGIDPGTRVTGYGVIQIKDSQYQAIDFGCIRPPLKHKISDRYLAIFNGVDELLQKFQPECVVVETQYMQKNVQSAIKLGMARGAVIIAARRCRVPVFEYTPTKAKSAVVGNGKASKTQVQRMIQKLLCLKELPKPEDAADALALAICHAQSLRFQQMIGAEI